MTKHKSMYDQNLLVVLKQVLYVFELLLKYDAFNRRQACSSEGVKTAGA